MQRQINLVDSLSFQKGAHDLKLGVRLSQTDSLVRSARLRTAAHFSKCPVRRGRQSARCNPRRWAQLDALAAKLRDFRAGHLARNCQTHAYIWSAMGYGFCSFFD